MRLIFPFNTSNSSEEVCSVSLRVTPVELGDQSIASDPLLGALPTETAPEIQGIGFVNYTCGEEPRNLEGDDCLELQLAPQEIVGLALQVLVDGPADAACALHITEYRDGELFGGITVAATLGGEPLIGQRLEPSKYPCRVELVEPLYLRLGTSEAVAYGTRFFVDWPDQHIEAKFRNPTREDLNDVSVYLESVSAPGAQHESLRIAVGRLPAGEAFVGRWAVDFGQTIAGEHLGAFVVQDERGYSRRFAHFELAATAPGEDELLFDRSPWDN